MDWVFLEQMMVKLGFKQKWIKLVVLCVKSVKYYVLINGDVTPLKGLETLRKRNRDGVWLKFYFKYLGYGNFS